MSHPSHHRGSTVAGVAGGTLWPGGGRALAGQLARKKKLSEERQQSFKIAQTGCGKNDEKN